jgi:hypothetical protein
MGGLSDQMREKMQMIVPEIAAYLMRCTRQD